MGRSSRIQLTELLLLWQRKLKSPFSGTVSQGPPGVIVGLDLPERKQECEQDTQVEDKEVEHLINLQEDRLFLKLT